jgi:hypothetical protein
MQFSSFYLRLIFCSSSADWRGRNIYQITDRLGGAFRVQRYNKYLIYANKIDKNRGEKPRGLNKRYNATRRALSHYHIKNVSNLLEMEYFYSCFLKQTEAESALAHTLAQLTAYAL